MVELSLQRNDENMDQCSIGALVFLPAAHVRKWNNKNLSGMAAALLDPFLIRALEQDRLPPFNPGACFHDAS